LGDADADSPRGVGGEFAAEGYGFVGGKRRLTPVILSRRRKHIRVRFMVRLRELTLCGSLTLRGSLTTPIGLVPLVKQPEI
jgi:hypothetical protein